MYIARLYSQLCYYRKSNAQLHTRTCMYIHSVTDYIISAIYRKPQQYIMAQVTYIMNLNLFLRTATWEAELVHLVVDQIILGTFMDSSCTIPSDVILQTQQQTCMETANYTHWPILERRTSLAPLAVCQLYMFF